MCIARFQGRRFDQNQTSGKGKAASLLEAMSILKRLRVLANAGPNRDRSIAEVRTHVRFWPLADAGGCPLSTHSGHPPEKKNPAEAGFLNHRKRGSDEQLPIPGGHLPAARHRILFHFVL